MKCSEIGNNNIEQANKIDMDKFSSYNIVRDMGYKHFSCKICAKEYVKNDAYVNNCAMYVFFYKNKNEKS